MIEGEEKKINQVTPQKCCKCIGHEKNKANYFCLDDICLRNRLFCHVCARLDHKKHRIGRIDRLIEPLSLLNINSFYDHSNETYQFLKLKMDEFYEVLGQLQNSFDHMVRDIQLSTFFQINCVLQTFSQDKIEEVEYLFQDPEAQDQKVREAIQMINFLQFQGVEDSDTVKKVCEITLQKMTKVAEKTNAKMQTIFQKMGKNIKENDFLTELKKYKATLLEDAKRNLAECHPINYNLQDQVKGTEKHSDLADLAPPYVGFHKKTHQSEQVQNKKSSVYMDKYKDFFGEENLSRKSKNTIVKKQTN